MAKEIKVQNTVFGYEYFKLEFRYSMITLYK